jgi:hypothetical protein
VHGTHLAPLTTLLAISYRESWSPITSVNNKDGLSLAA